MDFVQNHPYNSRYKRFGRVYGAGRKQYMRLSGSQRETIRHLLDIVTILDKFKKGNGWKCDFNILILFQMNLS